jgi:hypothetical protein
MPITGPNYFAVQNPSFKPAMRNILTLTQSNPALVTTTFDGTNPGAHGYISGLIARLIIPNNFGMVQANELFGVVTVVNDTQFTISIDTSFFEPFVVPAYNPGHNGTPAQVIPFGQINDQLINATQNVLPSGNPTN